MSNVAAQISEKILECLDKGVVPWKQPWTANSVHHNMKTGKAYRGLNILMLEVSRLMNGFSSSKWATFAQINELKGKVKKGAKASEIFFFTRTSKTIIDQETGEEVEKAYWAMKCYRVFNLDQTEKLDHLKAENTLTEISEPAEVIASYVAREGVKWVNGGNAAFYMPSEDMINVPEMNSFKSAEAYYSVCFHEMVHSTGAKNRLDRGIGVSCFGSDKYGQEELVAEFGAAFLCGHTGIDNTIEDSASYIQSWKKTIKANPEIIQKAAGKAEKAAEFVMKGVK